MVAAQHFGISESSLAAANGWLGLQLANRHHLPAAALLNPHTHTHLLRGAQHTTLGLSLIKRISCTTKHTTHLLRGVQRLGRAVAAGVADHLQRSRRC